MLNQGVIYSVSQLSKLAGVSVRTLHHYDEIGLLQAKRNSSNGYREYNQHDLAKLQQILIYRELGFSLVEITKVLSAENYELISVLKQQQDLLHKRISDSQSMLSSLNDTLAVLEGRENYEIYFSGIPKEKADRWKGMMSEKAGEEKMSVMYQRLSKLSKAENKALFQDVDQWVKGYIATMDKPADSQEVQLMVERHFHMTEQMFKKTMGDEFKGLDVELYQHVMDLLKQDPVTIEIYEHYQQGMAEHLYQAMQYFKQQNF
ncbi:MerR family transcriptional regulator [Parashewanella tropica]|uniref:MerR family transcriptional regulator n=1 Tax=Parashewanella tropica TaxID=2547970 RepID=UPI00105A7F2C|nr:MerR family transcriptional regulator [Parashewanella tropica]